MNLTSLLAVVELERDPPGYKDLPRLLTSWLQDAGGFALAGLALWIVYSLVRTPASAGSSRPLVSKLMLVNFLLALGLTVFARISVAVIVNAPGYVPPVTTQQTQDGITVPVFRELSSAEKRVEWMIAISGLLAILGIGEPFLRDFFRMRWGRIYAIARLSFIESIRRKVVWVFLIQLAVFLFPARWWFVNNPEDEIRTAITVLNYAMTAEFIFVGLLLSGFSIPQDVRSQTIHTIVTKPVERFEIVLGRFLGFLSLLTIALVSFSGIGLLLISASNVDGAAREKSMKARVPIYGKLGFSSERRAGFQGISVGREREYRRYIAGGAGATNRAIWQFANVSPSIVDNRDAVPVEFSFDIYRTTKGEEGKGVFLTFNFTTWNYSQTRDKEYQDRISKELGSYPTNVQPTDAVGWEKMNAIAEEFGRFEIRNVQHYDYHTDTIYFPPGLLRNLNKSKPTDEELVKSGFNLRTTVRCETESQFVGVAAYDLYILEAEGSFALNFFKGAMGLWARLAIILAISITFSTYLAGVISFLGAAFLFLLGLIQDFIESLARGSNVGGGPFESLTRLVRGDNPTLTYDNPTPTQQAISGVDSGFRWLLQRFLDVIPDIDRFTWTNYVSEGFSIRPEFIVVNMVILAGYLLPWFVVSYYLMKSREIAS